MSANKPVRTVQPNQPFSDWIGQLVSRRETLWFFIWKDLKVQYSKPIFGLLWSVFQPLVYFGIIFLVMRLSNRGGTSTEMPFALFLICGLTIWNFTTSGILGSINSLQSNAGIISKSFFPRFYLILSPIIKSCLDLVIMLVIVIGFAIYLGQPITLKALVFIPISMILTVLSTLGVGAVVATLVIANRHVRHAIPVLLYALIFVLPVFYSVNDINDSFIDMMYELNPIAGAMDCLRVAFGTESPSYTTIASWLVQSLIWLGVGVTLFKRTEKTLADRV